MGIFRDDDAPGMSSLRHVEGDVASETLIQNIFHIKYKAWFWKGELLDKPHFWSCKMGCIFEIPPVTSSGRETTKSMQR